MMQVPSTERFRLANPRIGNSECAHSTKKKYYCIVNFQNEKRYFTFCSISKKKIVKLINVERIDMYKGAVIKYVLIVIKSIFVDQECKCKTAEIILFLQARLAWGIEETIFLALRN